MKKYILGFFTALPLVYILGLLFVFRDFEFETIRNIHYVMMAMYIVLLVVYTYDVRTNYRVPDEKRNLWTALIFLGSSAAQLVYFWSYIWPTNDTTRESV